MRGRPRFNVEAFERAAAHLRALGHEVASPVEHSRALGWDPDKGSAFGPHPPAAYLRWDIEQVMAADAVAVLPGWESSAGAQIEVAVARFCGVPVLDAETLESLDRLPIPRSVCQEADQLVTGDRRADYGHPLDDFSRIATMWSAILGVAVSAEQVGLCQIAVKLSRQCHRPKRDNLVDICGYANCVQQVIEERARRTRRTRP